MPLRPQAMLAVLAVSAGFLSGRAWASCPRAESTSYTNALTALGNWEAKNGIALSQSAKATILDEFCESAKTLAAERKIDLQALDRVAPVVVNAYLDRAADPTKAGRSVGSLLRSQFGPPGLAGPEIKRYGRLSIVYAREVEALRVREEVHGPVTMLLVEVGLARIEGLKQSKSVCSGSVQISGSVEAKFRC